jgi:UDP-glucose 4-epimerase
MPYEINGSKILVTGGAGLVGSHIVDACINEGAKEVVVIDSLIRGKKSNLDWALKNGNVKFVKADITKPEAVIKAMKGCDYVFHEVAIRITLCEKDPRSCQEILVDGTFNVLEACIKNKIKKLVFASSASVYGESSYMPMDEKHPFNNLTAYGAGKIANE